MWIKVHETDLNASLSLDEIEAFRQSASHENDPLENQIRQVVSYVRGCIRTGGKATLSADEGEIPESLILPAMDYLRFQLLTRVSMNVNESRTKAYDRAADLFDQLRRGEFIPESAAESPSNDRAGAPVTGRPNPDKRLLD